MYDIPYHAHHAGENSHVVFREKHMKRRLTAAQRHGEASVEREIEEGVAHQHAMRHKVVTHTVYLRHTPPPHIYEHAGVKPAVNQIHCDVCLTSHQQQEPAVLDEKRSLTV